MEKGPDHKKEIVNYETGIHKCIEFILSRLKETPLYVGIYGYPDSGKSTLVADLQVKLRGRNIDATTNGSWDGESFFRATVSKDSHWSQHDVFLIQCGYDKADNAFRGEDPALLTPEIVGKQMSLSVGIYNPNLSPPLRGSYDLTIANDASKRKHQKKFDSFQGSAPS